jgi:hypothetical protein
VDWKFPPRKEKGLLLFLGFVAAARNKKDANAREGEDFQLTVRLFPLFFSEMFLMRLFSASFF